MFDGNGGDINSIIEKAMIFSVRNSFGKSKMYTIDFKDFKEALEIFVETKTHHSKLSLPPPGMYN